MVVGAGALVAAVLAVVVLVAGWPLAGPVRSDPNSDAGDVLDAAADALREAETFSYRGTVAAGGASTIWPAGLAGVGIEVDGRVALPVRVIERSRSLGLVVDTIVSGRGVWQRSAPPAGEVGDAPWGVVAEGPPALGLAQLPDLLDDAVEVQVSGSDRDGGRSLTAVVDQLDVGAPDGPVQARLDVVVDRAGVPTRAVIDVPAVGGGTPVFRLDVEIDDLGVAVDIGPPGERELGITPSVTPSEISAAGLTAPLQLTSLPEGVVLTLVELGHDWDPTCPRLRLVYYHAVDGIDRRVGLTVENEACVFEYGSTIVHPVAFDARWVGEARTHPTGAWVEASDGTSYVTVEALGLTADEVIELVTTLGPYDPTSQPSLMAPPGTPVLGGAPG